MPSQADIHVTSIITNTERRRHALLIPGYIEAGQKTVEIKGLIDTGADAVIINQRLVDKYNLPTTRLPQPIIFCNTDDSVNKSGQITHRVEGHFILKNKKLPTNWYVANIGRDEVIFGMPWIRKYNPSIDWESGQVSFDPKRITRQQDIQKYRQTHDPLEGTLWSLPTPRNDQTLVMAYTETIDLKEALEEDVLTHNPSKILARLAHLAITGSNKRSSKGRNISRTTKSTELAVAANQNKTEKPTEDKLPEFVKEYSKIFDKTAAARLPEHRSWDHPIDFKKDFDFHTKKGWRKLYPLSIEETSELKKFIKENKEKGYIRDSTSPIASPFFFVSKKDGTK